MEDAREDFDELAWDRTDEAWEESQKQLRRLSTCHTVASFVEKTFDKRATLVLPMIIGDYNILYRLSLEGASPDILARRPCPNLAQFPDEKPLREAATAAFFYQNTQLPIPQLFNYTLWSQNPEIGPFTILQHVENQGTLSHRLKAPNNDPSESHVLNPDISESTLECLYRKVACCLLQLSQPSFPSEAEGRSFVVSGRPITPNMNNMIRLANIPRAVLPPEDQTYWTADEWYVALAEMHMAQLVFQHNDLVTTEDDCRNKYVARQLFQKLARQGRLSTYGFKDDDWSSYSKTQSSNVSPAPPRTGSFRLWGDDLRPGNILLNASDDIVAVIDWEFTYVGPTKFILDPPWWLLLEVPEMWSSGIDRWEEVYGLRLKTWLSAMKQAEEAMGSGRMPFDLSTYMRESWETGRFWLNYAVRKSWAFYTIVWKYLDERFFGDREGNIPKHDLWKTRIHLLGEEKKSAMEPFVDRKMMESKQRVLIDWNPEEAKERLAEVLFD
ncbi:phosphotransferase [Colletotrichum cereale]|nr:phosphotransferase [Colletotrichum cereale]